jgi:hypothetical protein
MPEKPEITELRDEPVQPTEGKQAPTPTVETEQEEGEETAVTDEETEAVEEEKPKKDWVENFSVKKQVDIETIDRLTVKVGINEYKGNTLVFIAKVTDKNFSRQFFSMPAYVWQKALEELKKIIPDVAEVEKQTMTVNIEKELARLKELGIDITAIAQKVAGTPT